MAEIGLGNLMSDAVTGNVVAAEDRNPALDLTRDSLDGLRGYIQDIAGTSPAFLDTAIDKLDAIQPHTDPVADAGAEIGSAAADAAVAGAAHGVTEPFAAEDLGGAADLTPGSGLEAAMPAPVDDRTAALDQLREQLETLRAHAEAGDLSPDMINDAINRLDDIQTPPDAITATATQGADDAVQPISTELDPAGFHQIPTDIDPENIIQIPTDIAPAEDDAPIPTTVDLTVANPLDQVSSGLDMLGALDDQANPAGIPSLQGPSLDQDHIDAVHDRAADLDTFVNDRQAELDQNRSDLQDRLTGEGKTFSDLSDDEKADYYSQMLHTTEDMRAETLRADADINDTLIDGGRVIVEAHADQGDLDGDIISADRDKLDDLGHNLDAERDTQARQTETMHDAADEIADRIRQGESFETARQAVLQAHYDDLPPEVQATVAAPASDESTTGGNVVDAASDSHMEAHADASVDVAPEAIPEPSHADASADVSI